MTKLYNQPRNILAFTPENLTKLLDLLVEHQKAIESILDVLNAVYGKKIEIGAPDSGGSGYRLLRIKN